MEKQAFTYNNFFSKADQVSSMPRDLDEILHQKLEEAYHKHTTQGSAHDLIKVAMEHTAIDLAYATLYFPLNMRPLLYDNLPDKEAKIHFLLNTDSATRQCIFRYMSDQHMKKLVEKLSTDEVLKVMDDLTERRFKRILELIDPKKAFNIRELKKHERNSAGRLMTNNFFAFDMDMTIGEAAEYIRNLPRIEFTKGIFLVNESKELKGYIPARNLIINKREVPLRQIMRPVLHTVGPDATREEVVDVVERYKMPTLPVVDENNHLLGVIANEDVVEMMEDLADETLAKIAGTVEKVSFFDPMYKRFLARFPWLLVTLFVGLINMMIMSVFEQVGKGVLIFVLFFVPLITGMSGNIGIQSSTILVRSMALGMITSANRKESILKEIFMGIFGGVVFAICCGILLYCIHYFFPGFLRIEPFILSIIIGTGLLGACLTASTLGVCLPLFFARIGVDPAVASGPIVTALNDFLSMTIYFIISWVLGMIFF